MTFLNLPHILYQSLLLIHFHFLELHSKNIKATGTATICSNLVFFPLCPLHDNFKVLKSYFSIRLRATCEHGPDISAVFIMIPGNTVNA